MAAAATTITTTSAATTATLSEYNAWAKGLRQLETATACTSCGATGCALYGYGGEEKCLDCA
jgi:hypothetical protein